MRISICHCHACQKRTGSAFGVQARFPKDQVVIAGASTAFTRTDRDFPEPRFAVYEARRHPWVKIAPNGEIEVWD